MSIRFANPTSERRHKAQKRLRFFYIVLCAGYGVILARGLNLMLQDNQKLEKIAMKQYRAAIQMATDRNRILDGKGREMAISVPAWSLYSDPRDVKDPSAAAVALSPILGMAKRGLKEKLSEKKKFVWLKRRIDASQMEKVRRLNLPGIYNLKENMRFYPHGKLAATVLGVVGSDSQALGGIESAYDSYLMIASDTGVYLRDARGQLYVTSNPSEDTAQTGDVWLTLDKNLQFFAEQELSSAVRAHNAKAGVALMMDPKTGAILAMANYPSFDPNKPDFNFSSWRNRTVTDTYEPGSTFKIITAAAALEAGVISPSEKIFCENGAYSLAGGHVINDHDRYEWLNLGEIIKFSSNVGVYKISQKLGREKFYHVIRSFGFGEKTGIDFPGEVSGLVRPVQKWRPIETGTISFGQGIGVTSVQLLSAVSAIANGGVRMRPHLVEKVVGKNGDILYQAEPTILNRPLHLENALLLTRMMQGVVEEGGTATAAAIEEYPVAGKTGTAQKVDPKTGAYFSGKYIASFVGFAPADNPRLAMLVWLDEPSGGHYGGVVAAPVFKAVMQKALKLLGVPPQGQKGVLLAKGGVAPAPANLDASMTKEGDQFKVPDFHGVSLRHALKAAGHFPVEMEFKGRGEAISQSPPAGALVSSGAKIYVEFEPLY